MADDNRSLLENAIAIVRAVMVVTVSFGWGGCADRPCVDDGLLSMQLDESCQNMTTDAPTTDSPTTGTTTDTPGMCGDGVVDPGESCDDGNAIDDDGCTNNCVLASCGNGTIDPGEQCDDGNTIDEDTCTNTCLQATCGDGIVGPGESCDDGNTVNDDGCTNSCALASCGNGTIDPGEQCDDGNTIDTDTCTNACQNPICGDQIIGPGETCDDGNTVDDDGCTNDCVLASCGDGKIDPGEECDDGNALDTDTCTNACQNPICGDQIIGPGETCDDGNTVDDDGCTNECALASCGDGNIDLGEECDDGNTIAEDACTNMCTNAVCGDGILWQGMEECDDGNEMLADGCSNCKLPSQNYIFVSSMTYTGNLGGLAGADQKCNELAQNADLPGTFIAWLSDQNTHAKDRVGNATGWVRPDGNPVATTLDTLMKGNHLYPPVKDENGVYLDNPGTYSWTGTNDMGEKVAGELCDDWALETGMGRGGVVRMSTRFWTQGLGNIPCNTTRHLYCLSIDHNFELPPLPPPTRLAFRSNGAASALFGPTMADAQCTQQAQDAGFNDTFRALMVEENETPVSKFNDLTTPWQRADGVPVFREGEIMGTVLEAPVYIDAEGMAHEPIVAWGGAPTPSSPGTLALTCQNWSQTSGNANGGMWSTYDIRWSSYDFMGVDECTTFYPFLCFQE